MSAVGFINKIIKEDTNFITNLANMAAADCNHDFGINVKTANIIDEFSEALPPPAKVKAVPDEENVLNNIINNSDFKAFLETLKNNPDGKDLDIIIPNTNPTTTITTYNVIVYEGNNYSKINFNFGKDFTEKSNLFLDTKNAYLIVDFNQHGFMSKLKEGEIADGIIHYLMTPEVVNDPAGKPSIFDKTLFNSESGVNMNSYVQTTPTTTEYTPFSTNNDEFSNNFFSAYNFSLSPIQQSFEKGNISKLNTSLTITYNVGNKPYTNTITDSKKQNSINSLTGYVKGLINKLTNKTLNKFNFNSKLQQKRGGDWFQALCCLNVINKEFSLILPKNETNIPDKLNGRDNFKGPVYLVTHDRIALAFALINGVNVIYLANNKDTYLFKNKNDPIVKANSGPIAQLIHSKLVEFKTKPEINELSKYEIFKENYRLYNVFRNEIISQCKDEFNGAINQAKNYLVNKTELLLDDYCIYKDSFEDILQNIKSIFRTALLYSFILQNLPDVEDKYNFIEYFLNETKFIPIYDKTQDLDLIKIREYENNIESAFEKLGISGLNKEYLKDNAQIVKLNLSKALSKMDVSRAIDTLFSNEPTGKTEDVCLFQSRIKFWLPKPKSNEQPLTRAYEQYIFLKFITNLPQESIKDIIDIFEKNFIPVINKYGENLQKPNLKPCATEKLNRQTRGCEDRQKAIYLRPANFSNEVILILKPLIIPETSDNILTSITEPKKEDREFVLNESTDSILVFSDAISRIINEEIKGSDSIDYITNKRPIGQELVSTVQENVEQSRKRVKLTGGGLSNLKDFGRRNAGIVLDSNINQIIWDLLGNKINDNSYFIPIFNYIKFIINNQEITDDNKTSFINQLLEIYDNDTKQKIISLLDDPKNESLVLYLIGLKNLKELNGNNDNSWEMDNILQNLEEGSNENKDNSMEMDNIVQDLDESSNENNNNSMEMDNIDQNLEEISNENSMEVLGGSPMDQNQENLTNVPSMGQLNNPNSQNNLLSDNSKINISIKSIDNIVLLKDNLFCYHPLLPIYVNLTSFYNQIGPDFNGDPFYDSYIKYVNVLEKMTNVLLEQYLIYNLEANLKAYFIGYSLKTIFFHANKSLSLFNTLKNLLNLDDNETRMFSMKNDIFGGQIVGDCVIRDGDFNEIIGNLLMSTPIVINFINNQVNFREVILSELNEQQIPEVNDRDPFVYTSKLKIQITILLNKIVDKISYDRSSNVPDLSIPEAYIVPEEDLEEVGENIAFPEEVPLLKKEEPLKDVKEISDEISYIKKPSDVKKPVGKGVQQYKPIPMKTGYSPSEFRSNFNPMGFNSYGQSPMVYGGGTRKNKRIRKKKYTKRINNSNKRSIRKRMKYKHKKTIKDKNKN